MGKKRGSSQRWLREHHDDHYVNRARAAGYRSRSAYKLEQIQRRDTILRPGQTVVDLGAAPGGWSQFASGAVGANGRVFALDILDMAPVRGVDFLRGDFREPDVLAALEQRLGDVAVDLVLSDMAPNLSGIAVADQARVMTLAEMALDFARAHLIRGHMLVKVFQGEGFDAYLKELREVFQRVAVRKPDASRGRSRELYLLAMGHAL